ncbi:MAG: TonB family protein [Candidatus Aminicenantia bacterium]
MKKKILLVIFEALKIKEVKSLLEREGFQVVVAFDGAEGYELFKSEKPELVITEALLPRIHGFELCRRIRTESGGQIPVIILTGTYKGHKFRDEAINKYHATAFVEYPFDEKEFLNVVKNVFVSEEEEMFKTIPIKADTKEFLKEKSGEKRVSSTELFGNILKELEETAKKEVEERLDFKFFLEEKEEHKVEKAKEEKVKEKEVPGKEEDEELEKKLEATLSGLGIKVKRIETPKKEEFERKKTLEKIEVEPVELIQIGVSPEKKEVIEEAKGEGIEKVVEERKVIQEKEEIKEFIEEKEKQKIEETKGLEEELAAETKEIIPSEYKVETIKVEIPVQETIGDYILEEKIATGGMAELFKAKRKGVEGFEKTVALKRVLPNVAEDRELVEMLIDEAKIASQLNHPNIVQIFDLGKKKGAYFIALEYVHGKDLRTILKTLNAKGKLIPYDISAYIAMKICDALYYAHNKTDNAGRPLKIVHRDVSPQNILISYDGEVKLADFGVAKASTKLHQTVAGQIKGKMLYMSPEQSKGSKEIDWRADIYSLGCVLFEMVTGKKLFMADSEMAVLEKVQKSKIIKPSKINPDVPPHLEEIILKSLKAKPSERFQSALEMRKELEKFIFSFRRSLPDNQELSLFMAELFPGEFSYTPHVKKKEILIEEAKKEVPQILKFPEAEKKRRAFPISILLVILALVVLSALGFFAYNFLYGKKPKTPEQVKAAEIVQPKIAEKEEIVQQVEEKQNQKIKGAQEAPLEVVNKPEPKTTKEVLTKELRMGEHVRESRVSIPVKEAEAPIVMPKKVEEKKMEEVKTEEIKKEEVVVSEPVKEEPVELPRPKEEETPQIQPSKIGETKPQAPQTKEGDLVNINEVDVKPSPVKKVQPRLTLAVQRANAHGEILLKVLISESGDVLNVSIIKGVSKTFGMNEEALRAVKQWKFSPAIKSGKRVRVWMLVLLKF